MAAPLRWLKMTKKKTLQQCGRMDRAFALLTLGFILFGSRSRLVQLMMVELGSGGNPLILFSPILCFFLTGAPLKVSV